MAEVKRRAAAAEPAYEVVELACGDAGACLRRTCSSYLAAVEYAFEYLGRRDPLREGKVAGLEIVRVEGRHRDTVWTYRYEGRPAERESRTNVWGFDVTRHWHGPPTPTVRPRFTGPRYRGARL